MLSSIVPRWRSATVATRSRLQGATKQKTGRCSAKPSLAVSTKLGRRSYAMMYHDDPYVAHDYKKEPNVTIPAIVRTDLTSRGSKFCKDIRKEHQLIPGVVNRGTLGKPIMILIDPQMIYSLMTLPGSRFMGRRYLIDIEGLEKIEVIPQNLDVEPVGYFPRTVSFTLWDPKKEPKPRLPPHVHKKFFEPLADYPPLAEQMQARKDGTYVYKRFMGGKTQTATAPKL